MGRQHRLDTMFELLVHAAHAHHFTQLNILPGWETSCHQTPDDTPEGSLHNHDAPDGVCSASDAADAISTGYLNDQGSWTQHDRGTAGDEKFTVNYFHWSSNGTAGEDDDSGSYEVSTKMN